MQKVLEKYHLGQINREMNFSIGDRVRVHYKIKEGEKERIQTYEGAVIAIQNKASSKSFTVYKVSGDVGVERIFPLYAPTIEKIEKLKSNRVRRGKLYFLKQKTGKEGRLREIKKNPKLDRMFEKAQQLTAGTTTTTSRDEPAEEGMNASETPVKTQTEPQNQDAPPITQAKPSPDIVVTDKSGTGTPDNPENLKSQGNEQEPQP